MNTYHVYQFSAYRGVYRLIDTVRAASAADAAASVKVANWISGAMYVRLKDADADSPPREVPSQGWYAQTLTPF
jgi:hypothetical protein